MLIDAVCSRDQTKRYCQDHAVTAETDCITALSTAAAGVAGKSEALRNLRRSSEKQKAKPLILTDVVCPTSESVHRKRVRSEFPGLRVAGRGTVEGTPPSPVPYN
ncbi:hypothetical protein CB1_000667038 [Camelus ferus]|nr:hypothetical protein CB1_000667038 [Camelus ferus]